MYYITVVLIYMITVTLISGFIHRAKEPGVIITLFIYSSHNSIILIKVTSTNDK